MKFARLLLALCVLVCLYSCTPIQKVNAQVIPGANSFSEYIDHIRGKRVALLVNHTSVIDDVHLVDTLLSYNISVTTIFAPEHGFRGKKDAGESVNDQVDQETGIPIVSLYGKNKKPTNNQLENVDVVLFDIQDVGVRFYTYISSMHYMMEACAENNKQLIVLDRPNPNGDYFSGPILKPDFKSFVGMHPIPVVHGLTVGELSKMINEEGWLKGGKKCELQVVMVKNWNHNTKYNLPIKPSPNLPNYNSVRLYPSLCFFEATKVSVGRGTYFPFQVIGYPDKSTGDFMFIPQSIEGMAKKPKQEGVKCYGIDLRESTEQHKLDLSYFISFYNRYGNQSSFGLDERWFNLLAGNGQLIKDIKTGLTLHEIEQSWQEELQGYSKLRDKYLLYDKETVD
ncbi:DUF1343 domain-containing protein [Labilibacter sediminis]|nr:DUF1343 domain-containing protein [Labilibacter sediminis]